MNNKKQSFAFPFAIKRKIKKHCFAKVKLIFFDEQNFRNYGIMRILVNYDLQLKKK